MHTKARCVSQQAAVTLALLVASVQPSDAVKYTYDGAGRLIAVDYGNDKISTYAYDANGNMTQRTTETPTDADIRLIKDPPNLTLTGGVDFEYELIVTNQGPQAASDVSISDTVPFGVEIVAVKPGQGTCTVSGRTVNCDLGVVPANGSATVILEVRHGFSGVFTNRAFAAAAQFDANTNNNTDTSTSTQNTINDSDGDGMPNWWEEQHGLSRFSSSGSNGADDDTRDNDGFTNIEEFFADTDPNDPNDFPSIESITISSPVMLKFQTSPIRQYDLEFNVELTNASGWVEFQGDIKGDGSMQSVVDPGEGTNRFYRLEVEVPGP